MKTGAGAGAGTRRTKVPEDAAPGGNSTSMFRCMAHDIRMYCCIGNRADNQPELSSADLVTPRSRFGVQFAELC
jgi:hypothetical protein